jgi:hypothetical protein
MSEEILIELDNITISDKLNANALPLTFSEKYLNDANAFSLTFSEKYLNDANEEANEEAKKEKEYIESIKFYKLYVEYYTNNNKRAIEDIYSLNIINQYIVKFKNNNFIVLSFKHKSVKNFIIDLLTIDKIEFEIINIRMYKCETIDIKYKFYGTFEDFSKFNEQNKKYNETKSLFKRPKYIININHLEDAILIIKKGNSDFNKFKFHINKFNNIFYPELE